MATFPASPAPSQGTGGTIKPRVRAVSFGDGYSQRSADGINATPAAYPLMWKAIPETDRVTLNDFLVARGGYESFDWTPPNAGASIRVTCKDWSWTYGEYNLCDFRASFEQVYET